MEAFCDRADRALQEIYLDTFGDRTHA